MSNVKLTKGTFVGNHVHKLLQVRITNIVDINLLIVCQLF